MNTLFIIISTSLALISPLIYARAIFKEEAVPHRTTRLILLINTMLATTSLYAQGDRVAVWLAAVSTIQAVFIFLLSLKYGTGGWAKIDLICLLIAAAGITWWQTANNPLIALYASILSDFVGMVPTLIKTYKDPKSEIWQFWLIDTFVGALSLLAIRAWTPAEFSYPLYIMLINFTVAALVFKKPKEL